MRINKLIRTDLNVEIKGIKTNSKDVKKGDESAIDDLIDNIDLINGEDEYI